MKFQLHNGAVLTVDAMDVGNMWPNLNGTISAWVSSTCGREMISGITRVEI